MTPGRSKNGGSCDKNLAQIYGCQRDAENIENFPIFFDYAELTYASVLHSWHKNNAAQGMMRSMFFCIAYFTARQVSLNSATPSVCPHPSFFWDGHSGFDLKKHEDSHNFSHKR